MAKRQKLALIATTRLIFTALLISSSFFSISVKAETKLSPINCSAETCLSVKTAICSSGTVDLFIKTPEDILSVTHGGELALPYVPSEIQRLESDALSSGLAMTARVRDESGMVVGIASQIEYFNALVQDDKSLTHTIWTVQFPHSGTMIGYTMEHIPPQFTKILARVVKQQKPWSGQLAFQTSSGPNTNGDGVILAGAGEFSALTGRFVELNEFSEYSKEKGLTGRTVLTFRAEETGDLCRPIEK